MPSKSIAPIEIGSFTASSPEKTEFIGSASGVFFVNTVFRAFARSAYNSKALPSNGNSTHNDPGSVDSRLVDPETPMQLDHEIAGMRILIENETAPNSYGVKGHGLGVAPEQDSARELLMLYLKNWHPLFPFLHGPTLFETIRGLYEHDGQRRLSLRNRLCHAIICQCVFNIAALDQPDGMLAPDSRLDSPAKLLSLLGYVASNHDTLSLQALLAAQLYLVATMSLRAASTIGGTLTRVMYHAGFHRCAFRYPQLSPHECELRKRIFWSAYVLDRYLSQALGHPLGIQDSDLDVCVPGMDELHKPVRASQQAASASRAPAEGVLAHLPRGHHRRGSHSEEVTASEHAGGPTNTGSEPESPTLDPSRDVNTAQTSQSSQILGHYVLYCRLTGQAVQTFHISIQNRTINAERMMELQSNVHAWWNGLPQELQDEDTGDGGKLASTYTFFFCILYNHLLLLSNRPFLSLSPKSLEFKSSLQTCIAASRQIITMSRRQHDRGLIVSWPGMLSATWMAGLVLAFACTLKRYPFSKAQREIEDSIRSLSAMAKSWNNARHCAEALQSLLENLAAQYNRGQSVMVSPSSSNFAIPGASVPATVGGSTEPPTTQLSMAETNEPSRKRKRTSRGQQGQSRHQSELPDATRDRANQSQTINQDFDADSYQLPSLNSGAMFPILEYTGPDFGFSNGQYPTMDDFEFLGLPVSDDLYPSNPGAFGNIGWEAMANGSGNMQSWAAWGTPKF
ncbi:fungal specific transcription factor [Fonsecaea pedrosoi]|nr:fungal specific transcription factor [Fonsecaea pedrosoi]